MFLLSNEEILFQSAENISTECKRRSRKTKHKSSSYQSKAEVWILYKSLRETGGWEIIYSDVTTIKVNLNLFKLNLDRGATYLFPILFLTFNICYWTFYLVVIPSYQTDHMMEQEEWGEEGSDHILDWQLLNLIASVWCQCRDGELYYNKNYNNILSVI